MSPTAIYRNHNLVTVIDDGRRVHEIRVPEGYRKKYINKETAKSLIEKLRWEEILRKEERKVEELLGEDYDAMIHIMYP